MAIRTGSTVLGADGTLDVSWSGLLNGDSGTPVGLPRDYWKTTIQVVGTFGAGGTVLVEGNNDGVTWSTLKDVNNVAISITDNSIFRLEGIPKQVRARVSAGDGTSNLAVFMHGVI